MEEQASEDRSFPAAGSSSSSSDFSSCSHCWTTIRLLLGWVLPALEAGDTSQTHLSLDCVGQGCGESWWWSQSLGHSGMPASQSSSGALDTLSPSW